MKKRFLFSVVFILAACAGANSESPTTEEAWSDYCISEGYKKDTKTGVTVSDWDSEATTAGHRGVSSQDKMPPNPSTIRGC